MKRVLAVAEYGNIHIKLKELLDERNINRNQIASAIGTRFEVINKWCGGQIERIDADILARLCFVLDCEVEDLIEYVKK